MNRKTIIVIAYIAIGGVLWNPGNVCSAQTPTGNVAQTSPTNLPAGVEEIVKLTQAKMSEAVILTKIKNDGAAYNLTTDQIIYLSNQGVSQNVISALLQSKSAEVVAVPAINTVATNSNSQPSATVVEPPPLDVGDQTSVSDDPIIAKGKGFEIKRSDLDAVITGIKSAAAARGQTISPGQMTKIESQTLDRLIQDQLLLQKATDADRTNGVQKTSSQISALLERFGTQEALERQMKASGFTIPELRSKLTQENTAQAVKIRELNVTVTDAETKQYYDDNPASFKKSSGEKVDYATVAPKITDYLTQQKVGKLAQPYLDELMKAADVHILDADLKQTPVYDATAPTVSDFEKLTASIPNATLFANHTREYSFIYDKVWNAVSSILTEQHDKIIQSEKDSGELITDVTRHGIIGFPSYYKYCVLIEKENDTSTKMTLKLLLYYMDFDGTKGPPNTLEPQNSEFTNKKAEDFLDKVEKRLEKGN